MQCRMAGWMAVLAAGLGLSPVLLAQESQQPGAAQALPAAQALSHDLSGVWMQYATGDPRGLGRMDAVNDKFRPPFTPWGQARYEANSPLLGARAVAGRENNPHLRCDPDGPPALLTLPNPFEIVQIPGRVLMFFEEGHLWRTIWTDGRPLPPNPRPTWMGYSVGHWDGDTFVVDTVGLNDRSWADLFGDPRSDQMHVIERYRRLDPNTLELQITLDDPRAYTKPWVNPPKLHKLEPSWEIAQWFCIVDEQVVYDQVVRKPAGIAPPAK